MNPERPEFISEARLTAAAKLNYEQIRSGSWATWEFLSEPEQRAWKHDTLAVIREALG